MKKKFLFLLPLTVVLLVSCSKNKNIKFTPTPSTNKADYTAYDYSKHNYPKEDTYTTVLADSSAIKKGKPAIALIEPVSDWSGLEFGSFDDKSEVFGYDLRSRDVSMVDLSVVKDISDLTFNTDTIWPKTLPEGFDPDKLLEYNKNPGLGLRAIHKEGITGKGVSIAIIDQALLVEHEQYKNNLKLYERIHCSDDTAAMHGPAVASIAVGKDIGVAPNANLYYIAITSGHFQFGDFNFNASITADAILRILEINELLAKEDKIRVISISKGYSDKDPGYKELQNAIKKADEENIFVITTSTFEYYENFDLLGMDRKYDEDPDNFNSYKPAFWVTDDLYHGAPGGYDNYILAPIGSRTVAGDMGVDDYCLSHVGGLSWAPPWCAGLYALCCEVKPDLTPREFIEVVNDTVIPLTTTYEGKTYKFGKSMNPEAIIKELQEKK